MKRLIVLLGLLVVMAVTVPARGIPGPETPPPLPGQQFFIRVQQGSAQELFDEVGFTWRASRSADGWDWGGRTGYACGFAEFVLRGRVVAEVILQKWDQGGSFDGDSLYSYINSRGALASGGNQPCGRRRVTANGSYDGRTLPQATAEELSRSVEPGMPTAPPPHAMGHVIELRQNGVLLADLYIPHQSVHHPDTWWFRGDQAGELMVWYLERSTGDYGIVARLSCVSLVSTVTCSDYLVYE
jgi:hypothetical protein